jgi:molecular chaperone GrpE
MNTSSDQAPVESVDEVAELRAEIEKLREQSERYHANWQRSAADFQNWRRRADQERVDATRGGEAAVIADLLRVLDDFERAFSTVPRELRLLSWVEGVWLIGQKLTASLQSRGLVPIDAHGEEFDPYVHEAVLREDDADTADRLVVVAELQRGYKLHERVIRPTLVKVGRPPAMAESTPDEAKEGETDEPTA